MASTKYNLQTLLPKTKHPTAQATTVKSVNQKSGRTLKEMQTKKTKQLSAGMAAWVKANRGKLKDPTKKQQAIFKQYDALKKEGRLPSTANVKRRPSPQAQPSAKPKAAGTKPVNKVPQRFADGAKGGKYDKAVKNKEKAKSNFFRSSSGTRGDNLPSNPKLKSQPKKPKRSSFPAGRSGATAYAAALAKYRKLLARVPKVKRKINRRGRAI
jgi:hypothetical protein